MIQQHYATHFPMSGRGRYTHKTTMELPSWMIYHLGFLLGTPYSSQPRISSPKVALWSVVTKKPKDFLLHTQIKMLIFIVGIQDPIENWFPFLPFEDLNFVIHCWPNYDNAHDIFLEELNVGIHEQQIVQPYKSQTSHDTINGCWKSMATLEVKQLFLLSSICETCQVNV